MIREGSRTRSGRIERLRADAAKVTLACIRADGQRVSQELKPLFTVIEKRLFDPSFDVASLWRESGVNRDLSPVFRCELGVTPWAYISECRVEVGAVLLGSTDFAVREIEKTLGYASKAFTKAFKRLRRKCPTAFRGAVAESRLQRPQATTVRPTAGPRGDETRRQDPSFSSVEPLLRRARQASEDGDPEHARQELVQAQAVVRSQIQAKYSGILAVSCHEEGTERKACGDVDRAYQELSFAHLCYAIAGELPHDLLSRREELGTACDTDGALNSAFCPECRGKLDSPESFTLHTALRSALAPVSPDLAWFETCCDDCYRLVWDALSRARLGLERDAFKAWWLSHNVRLDKPDAPPSRGRFIAALAEVERRTFSNQRERLTYCDLALADAIALRDPLLEAEARIWRANVLRAMAEFPEARAELKKATPSVQGVPWLAALHTRMDGILEDHVNDYPRALGLLQSSRKLYTYLDPHIAGRLLVQEGCECFLMNEYEASLTYYREADSLLDCRRDSLPANADIPINSAFSFALLARWAEAESALSRCRYDRDAYPGLVAAEEFTRACIELLHGRSRQCLVFFAKASERFENLNRPLDVALVASYSVEAYVQEGDRTAAIESAEAALHFFMAAGCPQDTVEAAAKLKALLECEVINNAAVTSSVRSIARKHGGRLPVPEGAETAIL